MNKIKRNYDTIVIGGGQAGLSVGYHLKQQGRDFIILDASKRIGDAWRNRWDSLRLFTPARYSGLDGMPFPAPPRSFLTKDEFADYLETYADKFELPIQSDTRVDKLSREGKRFTIKAGDLWFEADNVVVAMSEWQKPHIPSFANELNDEIVQMHSKEYRNPSQMREGSVLVVGAANSGAEIARDVARTHTTWLSGNYPGHIPFRLETAIAQRLLIPFVLRILFHRILTIKTPFGRKMRSQLKSRGMPLVRTKPIDIETAGIKRLSKTVGTRDGLPVMEDGRVLDVANVIWCTGFHSGFSWIDLPIFGENHEPMQERGVVASEPGLYFVGLTFTYAKSSSEIHGVGRDAKYIVDHIATRSTDATVVSENLLKFNVPDSV